MGSSSSSATKPRITNQQDYINGNKDAREKQMVNDISTNASLLGLDKSFLDEMADAEVGLFNYAYMDQGMTEKEATGMAFADQAKSMGLDFLGGALSGGVMSGGNIVLNQAGTSGAKNLPRMSMEDFVNIESPVWNNVEYKDIDTQQRLMQEKHQEMVAAGEVVTVPESATDEVAQSYPDLRHMKKSERNPILKQKIRELKDNLREMLNGLKGAYEFEVNGYILEARLYDTGIKGVLEKITQEKAEMLTQSGEIFRKAQYLYSTSDYEKNTNIYRWNYFYTPVQIGDQTVGVRIAVRDVVRGTNLQSESQIYNWNIKRKRILGRRATWSNDLITQCLIRCVFSRILGRWEPWPEGCFSRCLIRCVFSRRLGRWGTRRYAGSLRCLISNDWR